jgi:hypothetical protein
MKIMHTCPLLWAMGMNFDPYFEDANQIAIQIDIGEDEDWETYQNVVAWLYMIVPLGGNDLNDEEAQFLWNNMTL